MEDQTQTTEETQTTETPTPPSLALSDLVTLLNIVRVTADRGDINAEEMSVAGAVYEKLFVFLQASGAINTQSAAPTQEAPAADETPAE